MKINLDDLSDLSNNLKTKQLFGKLDVGFENDLNGGFIVNQNEPNPAKDKAIIKKNGVKIPER
jgi:hypothetical protein